MSKSTKLDPGIDHDLLIAEYNSLVAERSQRMGVRYQLIGLTMIALGTILGLKDANLLLLFPILSFFLLIIFTSNISEEHKIADFIKDHIEVEFENIEFGWQTYKNKNKEEFVGGVVYSGNRLFFFISDLVALFGGIFISKPDLTKPFELILVAIAAIFTVLTLLVGLNPDRFYGLVKKVLGEQNKWQ
jgi:hypothetical protein